MRMRTAAIFVLTALTLLLTTGCVYVFGYPIPPHIDSQSTGEKWQTCRMPCDVTFRAPCDGPIAPGLKEKQEKEYAGNTFDLFVRKPFSGIWEPTSIAVVRMSVYLSERQYHPDDWRNAKPGRFSVKYLPSGPSGDQVYYRTDVRVDPDHVVSLLCHLSNPGTFSLSRYYGNPAFYEKMERIFAEVLASISMNGKPLVPKETIRFVYTPPATLPPGLEGVDKILRDRHPVEGALSLEDKKTAKTSQQTP